LDGIEDLTKFSVLSSRFSMTPLLLRTENRELGTAL
jgi:hypothetical protein